MANQHANLTAERWSGYTRGQQILMIANEMNRAAKLLGPADRERLGRSYERVLALTDLTVEVNTSRSLRRELLRWRDLVAERYIAAEPNALAHAAIFKALLSLHPEAWRQLPYVTLGRPA
jgi:hypothetical protein